MESQFKIPSTNIVVPRIGLGTYRTFDVASDKSTVREAQAVLGEFHKLGGRLVDSSPMYGSSEEVLGDISQNLKINDDLFVATKVWTHGGQAGIDQMEESLKKLRRKKVELMQIHNLVDWRTHIKTLRKWKDEGRVTHIGITHYTETAFSEMEKIIRAEPLDFIQIPYSVMRTEAEKSLAPLAVEKGMAVIANEPFAQGALFSRVKGKDLPKLARDLEIKSWAQYFLKFILSSPYIHFVIPATRRLDHLRDNMAAAKGPMPTQKDREKLKNF